VTTLIAIVFVLGYLAIALEHPLKLNKAATALLLASVIWVLCSMGAADFVQDVPAWFLTEHGSAPDLERSFLVDAKLLHLMGETAQLLVFLLGAMTIVELVDVYEGFAVITDRVHTRNRLALMWIIGWLTFFMSSVLDNLTTTIVMVSLLRKLVKDQSTRLLFVGLVVIAANAGGAWTPIGDVTTTMLWMAGKFTPAQVMTGLFVPSVLCLLVPLLVLSVTMRGSLESAGEPEAAPRAVPPWQRWLFLCLGLGGLLGVPVFKTLTHLPPYVGMMFSLAIIWIVSEMVNSQADEETRSSTGVVAMLRRIDMASILFFLGILLAVGGLGASGLLTAMANSLDATLGSKSLVALVVGLISAVIDNVPLVAAGIGMYELPQGDPFWLELAYCAGTGGSCLIIGSAAGVAAMGLERIDFLWYLRKVAPLALAGYLAGYVFYVFV
jgi:Na+/H+ antiporter NhaD/arsenite permease-like protein